MPQVTNIASAESLVATNLFSLKPGFVAVITGGATGIGLMISQVLAANGATVYTISRRADVAEQTAEVHGGKSAGNIIPLIGDITSKADLESCVSQIKEGKVDLLVNNSGISGPSSENGGTDATALKKKLFESEFSEWDDTFRTNCSAIYFTSVAFLPLLEAGKKEMKGATSSIINISSISGFTKVAQGHFCYNSSKAAAVHLTRLMSHEWAGLGIRVNSIAPGVFPSEMTDKQDSDEKTNQTILDKEMEIPAKRPGNVHDMAQAAMFLTCCQYMNGQIIAVDGGFLSVNPSAM